MRTIGTVAPIKSYTEKLKHNIYEFIRVMVPMVLINIFIKEIKRKKIKENKEIEEMLRTIRLWDVSFSIGPKIVPISLLWSQYSV